MAISDILNRRVRARPDEDDEIYSEQSSGGEEVSQGEDEQIDDSNTEDLDSDNVRPRLTSLIRVKATTQFYFSQYHSSISHKMNQTTQPPIPTLTPKPTSMSTSASLKTPPTPNLTLTRTSKNH